MIDASTLRHAIEAELEGNLLPFWHERSLDEPRGGFIAEMANDGTLEPDARKGLILNARLLWSFSALFADRRDPRDLELAQHAYAYLENHFSDSVHGGYFWLLDAHGQPLDGTKKIYGQAFVVYALASYAEAARDEEALDSARELFELIERHAHDDEHDGYIEARAQDWSEAADLRLSDKDLDTPKSMNTHLHVLEAYTALLRVSPDERLEARLRELIDLFGSRILDTEAWHLQHFFDETWTVLSDTYTYGHDIEAAWLLCEGAEVLAETGTKRRVGDWAVRIARAVLAEGVDADGALAYEGRDGAVADPNRDWWCQAEAVVGFWQAHALTGERAFADAALGVWRFIERSVVDREHGEWFWRVLPDGTPDPTQPKVSEWKGPYHSVRVCLEMLRRLAATPERNP